MQTRWSLPAPFGWCILALAACATADDPTGAGGAGASGNDGGAAGASVTATSSHASTGTGGIIPQKCGNGMLDEGEACDGALLDGKDCSSFGLGEGILSCNDYCGFYLAECGKVEICNDGIDNDADNQLDCEDGDCLGAATCVDSCTPTRVLGLPDTVIATTRGRPAVHKASCSKASGNEVMFELTSLTTGKLLLDVTAPGAAAVSLSVRTQCVDDASEIACLTAQKIESLAVDVVAGTTYFVMVDSVGVDPANFTLHVQPWQPESNCQNLVDDDDDGYLDCDDATGCQGTSACAPGAGAAGTPCTLATECAANHGDPVCLPPNQAFPGGYCSEFCDLGAPDCAGDGVCAQLGLSVNGVCLDGCTTDADCRAEYVCADVGNGQKACLAAPETSCSDDADNDGNGTFDCGDPSCQALPACTPGPAPAGQPCTLSTECASGSNDPLCVNEGHYGWPGGYCTEHCTLGADDCPSGSVCVNWFQFQSGDGTCMQTCDTMADCRPNYGCFNLGVPQSFCVF